MGLAHASLLILAGLSTLSHAGPAAASGAACSGHLDQGGKAFPPLGRASPPPFCIGISTLIYEYQRGFQGEWALTCDCSPLRDCRPGGARVTLFPDRPVSWLSTHCLEHACNPRSTAPVRASGLHLSHCRRGSRRPRRRGGRLSPLLVAWRRSLHFERPYSGHPTRADLSCAQVTHSGSRLSWAHELHARCGFLWPEVLCATRNHTPHSPPFIGVGRRNRLQGWMMAPAALRTRA